MVATHDVIFTDSSICNKTKVSKQNSENSFLSKGSDLNCLSNRNNKELGFFNVSYT